MTETVGQQLQKARLARTLSLEQAAHATHIRSHYLKALEDGDYRALPSLAQARGFLRAYADYLGLDAGELLRQVDNEAPALSLATSAAPNLDSRKPDVSSEQADAIFAEVGEKLRQHRELLGLSLSDVERHTHLRMHYLQAMEAGNLKGLPSPVQGRGMLNNYATFLGLDPNPLLLRFAEGLQAHLAARQATRPQRRPSRPAPAQAKISPFRRLLSLDFLIGGAAILFLAGFVLWGGLRVSAMRSLSSKGTATPTSPSIAEILLSTETAPVSPAVLTPTLNNTSAAAEPPDNGTAPAQDGEMTEVEETLAVTDAPVTLPAASRAPIQVYLVIRQRAWLRVIVDAKVEFEGRVMPGRAYTFQADERIEILTGNGAALQVFFNQSDLGVLGAMGEIVYRVFTSAGVETPTATMTFTPLPTPQTTPTPLATALPAPTGTATSRPQ